MCAQCELILRELYEAQKKLAERNFAHGHSYAEWRDYFLRGGR